MRSRPTTQWGRRSIQKCRKWVKPLEAGARVRSNMEDRGTNHDTAVPPRHGPPCQPPPRPLTSCHSTPTWPSNMPGPFMTCCHRPQTRPAPSQCAADAQAHTPAHPVHPDPVPPAPCLSHTPSTPYRAPQPSPTCPNPGRSAAATPTTAP